MQKLAPATAYFKWLIWTNVGHSPDYVGNTPLGAGIIHCQHLKFTAVLFIRRASRCDYCCQGSDGDLANAPMERQLNKFPMWEEVR